MQGGSRHQSDRAHGRGLTGVSASSGAPVSECERRASPCSGCAWHVPCRDCPAGAAGRQIGPSRCGFVAPSCPVHTGRQSPLVRSVRHVAGGLGPSRGLCRTRLIRSCSRASTPPRAPPPPTLPNSAYRSLRPAVVVARSGPLSQSEISNPLKLDRVHSRVKDPAGPRPRIPSRF